MRYPLPRFVFWLSVLCFLYAACSCAALKKAGWTAGGAGGGAAVGAAVGGPMGAAVGGAAGGIAANVIAENDELREGDLIGNGAAQKFKIVEVPKPFIPTWLWLGVAAYLAWTKGHHILTFLKGGGVSRLTNIVLPSWAQKSKKSAPSA